MLFSISLGFHFTINWDDTNQNVMPPLFNSHDVRPVCLYVFELRLDYTCTFDNKLHVEGLDKNQQRFYNKNSSRRIDYTSTMATFKTNDGLQRQILWSRWSFGKFGRFTLAMKVYIFFTLQKMEMEMNITIYCAKTGTGLIGKWYNMWSQLKVVFCFPKIKIKFTSYFSPYWFRMKSSRKCKAWNDAQNEIKNNALTQIMCVF